MAVDLIQKIKQSTVIEDKDCLVVGLSGGPDSVCLLHGLVSLQQQLSLTIYAAHLNHNLRGMDANQDAAFAMAFSKQLGIHCLVKSVDVEAVAKRDKVSLEAAGRLCRYQFLHDVAEKTGADKVAVAHHLNDQAETLLLHLLRGSGLTGLVGMVPQRSRVVRPLLEVSREDILRYCDQHQLAYCNDTTNQEPVVLRNRVRLELIPLLETYNPAVVRALGRTATLLERDERALDSLAEDVLAESRIPDRQNRYEVQLLQQKPEAVLSRVIRKAWRRQTLTSHTLQMVHVEQVMAAIRQRAGEKSFHLPGNVVMTVTREALHCHKKVAPSAAKEMMPSVVIQGKGITWLPQGRGCVTVLRKKATHPLTYSENPYKQLIDAGHISKDLSLRQRRGGEMWQPLGLQGSKSVKKTLMEMKTPLDEREQQLLLYHGDEVIWVVGGSISHKVRVTSKTQELLVIEYHEEESFK